MDDAVVVGRREGYWVVEANDRRYFLVDAQFSGEEGPRVGLTGRLGYRQGAASKTLVFTDRAEAD